MSPTHHLPQGWIMAWASGTLPPAHEILAATHLTLCPHCRARVAQAEEAIGALIERETCDVEPPEGALDALLARLDEPVAVATPELDGTTDPSGILPLPLAQLTGPFHEIRWRWVAPKVKGIKLDVPTIGLPLRLIKIRAGHRLPIHDHDGPERAIVLRGGWRDQTGHYRRGDACFVSEDMQGHEQVMDDDTDCIAIVLNDTPIKARNSILRLAASILKV